MQIKELIKKLKTLNQNKRVIINGYEGGYSDITELEELKIALNVNKGEWYFGLHDDARGHTYTETDEAVLIS